METTKKLSKEERLERALRISKQLLDNKRTEQQQMKEDMANPNSSLFNSEKKMQEKDILTPYNFNNTPLRRN
jgi:hypothetical protein